MDEFWWIYNMQYSDGICYVSIRIFLKKYVYEKIFYMDDNIIFGIFVLSILWI